MSACQIYQENFSPSFFHKPKGMLNLYRPKVYLAQYIFLKLFLNDWGGKERSFFNFTYIRVYPISPEVAKTCCPKNMSLFSIKKYISMIFRVFLHHFTFWNSTSIIQRIFQIHNGKIQFFWLSIFEFWNNYLAKNGSTGGITEVLTLL